MADINAGEDQKCYIWNYCPVKNNATSIALYDAAILKNNCSQIEFENSCGILVEFYSSAICIWLNQTFTLSEVPTVHVYIGQVLDYNTLHVFL